jgi:hypothetical protein
MQAPFSRFGVPIEKGGMVLWEVVVVWFHEKMLLLATLARRFRIWEAD